jgi:hypothetical protein
LTKIRSSPIGHMLTEDLLRELDVLWPDRAPDPKDPDMLIKCAERAVINTLWAKFNQAKSAALPGSP